METNTNKYLTIIVLETALLLCFLKFNNNIFIYAAITLGVISIASKYLTDLIHNCWMKLAVFLGTISNSIILTFVFILFVIPIGLLKKIFKKKDLIKKNSNFINRKYLFNLKDFDKLW